MMTTQEIDAVVLPPDIQADIDEFLGRETIDDAADGGKTRTLSPEDKATLIILSGILVDKRTEAVDGRRESGIETVWARCEDAHDSIDEQNIKTKTGSQRWSKPISMDGPLTADVEKVDPDEQPRSTAFVPVTRRYTAAGFAKVCEIALPPDDKTFTLDPTPVPELIKVAEDTRQLQRPDGELLTRDATEAELAADQATQPLSLAPQVPPALAQPGTSQPPAPQLALATGGAPADAQQPLPPGKPLLVKDIAGETMTTAQAGAEEAEKIIQDWQIESQHTKHVRKALFDAAKIGTGVIKAPFSRLSRSVASIVGADGKRALTVKKKTVPGTKRVNPWHFFPDPSCGDDIQNGEYCWERDFITERTLSDLRFEDGYIAEFIDQVIKEGPGKIKLSDEKVAEMGWYDKRYEIWYYEGFLKREEILALNPDLQGDLKDDEKRAMMLVTMVNDVVIRGVRAPLESGEFSYNVVIWSDRTDSWAGVGIGEQGYMAQRLINAATRAWIDNAGLSAGCQIIVDKVAIDPVDGHWVITPNKLWQGNGNAEDHDVAKAFQLVQFPNVGAALEALVMYGFRLYEECTNIPLITQGQSGKTTPQTLGATQIQDSNANQMLRSVAANIDDGGTEPMTRKFYQWLLLDPNVPDSAKQDYHVNARGSSALAERFIQGQVVSTLLVHQANPAFKLDPMKCMKGYLQANKLIPLDYQYSEDRIQEMESAPPPKDIKLQIEELRAQVKMMVDKSDTDRDRVYTEAESARTQIEFDARNRETDAKIKLAILNYATQRQISISDANSELAQTVMKLQTQKILASQDRAGEALKPPTEPPGRAADGKSFQQ